MGMYRAMHDPTSATMQLGGASAVRAGDGFLARYGIVFVWHAISAVLAWCVVAPVAFAWLRLVRRAGTGINDGALNVRYHRAGLVAVVVLTVQAWLVAVTKEHNTPPAHAFLGSAVLLIAVVHAVWYTMQSSIPSNIFEDGNNILSVIGITLATYTCHHSIYVFKLTWIPAAIIHTCLALSFCWLMFANFAPVSACKRISGIRPGYFEQGNDDHITSLNINSIAKSLTPHLGFRVVEDDADTRRDPSQYALADEDDEEDQSLALVTPGDPHDENSAPYAPASSSTRPANSRQRADT